MKRRPAKVDDRNGGFTLVELLVAFVVLGLILAAVAGGIRFGNRAWEASGERSAAIEDVAAVQRFLSERIGKAMLLPADIGGRISQVGLLGDATRLRFVAPWLSPVGSGGLYLFELGRTADGHVALGWTLLHPELAGGSVTGPANTRIMLRHVDDFDIRYFGDLDFSDTPGWQSRWSDPAFMPRLVAVNVQFSADDPRLWPTLIVAPHAQAFGQ